MDDRFIRPIKFAGKNDASAVKTPSKMAEKSRVLVIRGFIGKFIVEASAKFGHPIFALVRESTLSDLAKANIAEGFRSLGVNLVLPMQSCSFLAFGAPLRNRSVPYRLSHPSFQEMSLAVESESPFISIFHKIELIFGVSLSLL